MISVRCAKLIRLWIFAVTLRNMNAYVNDNGIIKSRKTTNDVIPAKAGIQKYQLVTKHWTPAFAGVTTFYEFVNDNSILVHP
jgi:hypothetical protein